MFLIDTTSPRRVSRERRTLAAGLERAVARARRADRSSLLTAAIPVARRDVQPQAERMLALAAALRSARYLPDAGVAVVRDLLRDGAGPLYIPNTGLDDALTRAEIALELR